MLDQINPIFSVAILIVSVIAHEVSHGYMADILGDPTARLAGRLTLNPLKHIDPFGSVIVPFLTSLTGFTFGWAKPVPFNSYNLRGGDKAIAAVAFAGPVMNLFIAFIFGLIVKLKILNGLVPLEVISLLVYIVIINVVLACFNLVPIPPFDGSKILFATLSYKHRMVEAFLERNQFIFFFIFIFFIWGIIIEPVINFVINFIIT
ncbi:MAG: site-2 protease family protein [bacterium]